ncbi:MAG: nucleotidyltransferase domain-containing protein [Pedobacter sp.]|nr:nucleotidyltransferase domain-containing protein [Pedobacter sp.]
MKLIDDHIDNLNELCSTHSVDKMYIFGSALNSNFNSKSDMDFLVKFKSIDLANYFDNYMDFKEKLKNLFGRDIDLVEEQTLRNPILIRSINRSKELVYG